jgi:high affinity Mn2+ porin
MARQMMRVPLIFRLMLSVAVYGAPGAAAIAAGTASPESPDDRFSIHWQATYVEQETRGFKAPYHGPNSLSPDMGRETVDSTLFAGARLWSGAEAWINPEMDQGFGLDNTLGVAGFPSGEAYKVGKKQPYFRLQRLFVRQTLNLGEAGEPIEGEGNQFACSCSPERVVLTVGKFSVTDVFDTNQYAHDPKKDFLNWALLDAGSFDYAADSWGYTVGAAVEWYLSQWTLRAGVFDMSDVPNSAHLEPGFHEFQLVGEIERRHEIHARPGRLLLTVFNSRARMGLLDEAVSLSQATGTPVDIAAIRRYRSRLGASLNLEQQVAGPLGLFARVGKAAGDVEAYEFSDIDRTASAGLSLKGSQWNRSDDTVAVATVINGISGARERYLNAGGLGILIGDGKLPNPGPEKIVETYYDLTVWGHIQLTVDYQWVDNPAYNRDRGPVSIFAVRTHVQF